MSESHSEATALGVPWTPEPAAKPGYGPDPGCQPCPDCGGLECLCRPRFFAGQLLTEQDLNRLDHYIVEKNKLHNRHLVGWGVVCGLEVLCDQCEERVRVTPGYAISPCGEDIVVCKPDYVDICALIDRCRKSDLDDCRPYAGKDGCEAVEEEWVLAIRYMESPARGMTALTGPSSCGCGGKGAGGCSCAGTDAPAAKNGDAPRLRRGAPPSCEPTVVCESYRYEIFRNPEKDRTDREEEGKDREPGWLVASFAGFFDELDGDLARRIACCLHDLEKAFPVPPGDIRGEFPENERQAWVRWACAAKRSLATYLARVGGGDCEAVKELNAILVPNAESGSFPQQFEDTATQLAIAAWHAMLHCVCSNLLPPCPPPGDPRVPLAVVTVRRTDCDIIKVCNWTPLRRHVTTFPNLDYWFGWVSAREKVREFIEAACCNGFGLREGFNPFGFPPKSTATPIPVPPDPTTSTQSANFDPGNVASRQASTEVQPEAPAGPIGATSPIETPLRLGLGTRRSKAGIFARAALAGIDAAEPTGGDLFNLAFQRRVFPAGPLKPEDEKQVTDSLAQSGLVRTLVGIARATGVPGRATDFLGGVGRDRLQQSEVADLRSRLDRHEAEIVELRRSLGAAARPDEAKD